MSNGNKFQVGITFEDPGNASLMSDALLQFRKEATKSHSQLSDFQAKDYQLKEGQTIHVNLKNSVENSSATFSQMSPPPLLPPPGAIAEPGSLNDTNDEDSDDDFGDFVS